MLDRSKVQFSRDSQFGYVYATTKFVQIILKSVLFRLTGKTLADPISKTQLRISKYLFKLFDGQVKYGPFQGLRMTWDSSWGSNSRCTMLLGIYESELLTVLKRVSKHYRYFIDIGAADGYYAVGVLVGNLFEKTYCFEASVKGRKIIERNANLNDVSERISISGPAVGDFFNQIQPEVRSNAVLLIDIEGGEFEMLSSQFFEAFNSSVILVEIHDWMVSDSELKLENLKLQAQDYFEIKELKTAERNPGAFKELVNMTDSERWIACSEGRDKLQSWWLLIPRSSEDLLNN